MTNFSINLSFYFKSFVLTQNMLYAIYLLNIWLIYNIKEVNNTITMENIFKLTPNYKINYRIKNLLLLPRNEKPTVIIVLSPHTWYRHPLP